MIYIYIYIHMYICMYVYIYIYIYRERERGVYMYICLGSREDVADLDLGLEKTGRARKDVVLCSFQR